MNQRFLLFLLIVFTATSCQTTTSPSIEEKNSPKEEVTPPTSTAKLPFDINRSRRTEKIIWLQLQNVARNPLWLGCQAGAYDNGIKM